MSAPLETCNSTWFGREHTSEDASQHGRKVSEKSKVMVKPTKNFRKIHKYLYRIVHTCMHKKTNTYVI